MSVESESFEVVVPVPGAVDGSYPVRVGSGLWERLAEMLREHCPAQRYALIADERVAALHAAAVTRGLGGSDVSTFTFAPGESSKTRETWADLTDAMLRSGFGRDSAVLALGGGVAGDLAGFVAATYMRGLPLVQLPTTLLAMIDSSVGGKTGVDTPAGKNLVGAFHPPRLVVADIGALRSLPAEHLSGGLAEAVKHGAIADAAYLAAIESNLPALLSRDAVALARLVRRSVEIKAEVVARDERESGPRKILNFGHTLGHALEAVTRYELAHGAAVSIGMVLEAELGERLGITRGGTADRLRAVLGAAGLPVRVPGNVDPDAVLAATRSDKKARAGRVEYVLLESIGRARWGVAVDEREVAAVLA